MRVALVHDWLTGMRGGERVLEALLELFPEADVFTLVARPERLSPALRSRRIFTSTLQRIPFGRSRYRWFLPLFRFFMGRLDLSAYDAVVSSSSACAKWVHPRPGATHVCYCHTPMRYVWDLFDDYFGPRSPLPVRLAGRIFRDSLRRADLESNASVTYFLANSREVAERIRRLYGREARVLYPPVDVDRFAPAPPGTEKREFLALSALVPYKRLDLAVRVFSRRGLPLRVVGEGPEERRLRRLAGPSVSFHGPASEEEVPRLLSRARALVFPGLEDFGIVPVEALASGCPVIAYGRGGVLDTLEDGATGPLFSEQTETSLEGALNRFLAAPPPDPGALARRARAFARDRFLKEARDFFRGIGLL